MDVEKWMVDFTQKLKTCFGKKLLFVGLQGSYRRGEATPSSDIDVVTVLDVLRTADLEKYRSAVAAMPEAEKACGFICGVQELRCWPKHELFALEKETRAYWGTLSPFLPKVEREDIVASARIGAANLYHETCHRFLYQDRKTGVEQLKGAYKSAFFALQLLHYLRTGEYCDRKQALLGRVREEEKRILEISRDWEQLGARRAEQPEAYFELLIRWSSSVLKELS